MPLSYAMAPNEDAAQHRTTTKGEYDAIVTAAASATAAPRHERSFAARRVAPSAPAPVPRQVARRSVNAPGNPQGKKPVEMRRVGDAAWRWFESQSKAVVAFGVSHSDVSYLIRDPSKATDHARENFEARPAPSRKRERKRKARGAPPKSVEGAYQKQNGKWVDYGRFPGREFDDLDTYRAAKRQREARRAAWSAQAY